MAHTHLEAVTELRDRLFEATAATWTNPQLVRFLNEGLRDVARRTLCLTTQATISSVAGTGEYTLASDILRVFRVEWIPGTGRRQVLAPRPYQAMDAAWWNDQDRTSSDPLLYTVWGNSPTARLKLYPVPDTSVVNGIRLFYARLPLAIPSATDPPSGVATVDMVEGWIDLALDYAEYLALRRDGQLAKMASALSEYERKIGNMVDGQLIAPGHGMTDASNEMVFDGPWPLPRWLVDPGY